MNKPTDVEIDELWRFEASKNWDSTLAMRTNFTRAALARWGAQPVPAGYALVPVEVRNLYDFMCTAFVPMTGQHDQIAISLDLAKAAMLSAAPQPVDREPVARLEIGKTQGGVSLTHIAEPAAFQLPEGMYALYTTPQPTQAGEYQPSSADMVMAALDTEEWSLERMQRCDYLTDEGNRERAWLVKRQKAPYCATYTDKPGEPYGPRSWSGPTALDALQKAANDLGIRLPQPTQPQAGMGGKPVHQFRREHCSDWYDGLANHGDGGGPYEERTLYTSGAEPLTRQQLREAFYNDTACTLGGDVDLAEKVCRVVEKAHGIKGGQHDI